MVVCVLLRQLLVFSVLINIAPVVLDHLLEGDIDSEGLTVRPYDLLAVCPLHCGALCSGEHITHRPGHGVALLAVAGHLLLHHLRDQVGQVPVSAGVHRHLGLIHQLVH